MRKQELERSWEKALNRATRLKIAVDRVAAALDAEPLSPEGKGLLRQLKAFDGNAKSPPEWLPAAAATTQRTERKVMSPSGDGPPAGRRTDLALAVTVTGEPKAQPRPRATCRGGRLHVYTPESGQEWRQTLLHELSGCWIWKSPIAVACCVTVTFYLRRPRRLLRKSSPIGALPHIGTPDIDNLSKSVLDALTKSGVLSDDRVITVLNARKYYCAKGASPCAIIRVETLTDTPSGRMKTKLA